MPASAFADATVVADSAAQQVTALGGRIVWVTGAFGHQNLMQRNANGAATAVIGAPWTSPGFVESGCRSRSSCG